MNKRQRTKKMRALGTLGGTAVFKKYGKKYMSELGRKGANKRHGV